jgi:uncharacterized membrane protein YdjX (TVP38/TMEM64 family)
MVKRKWLFGFRYPKLIGFILTVILAYLIFRNPAVADFVSGLGEWGYIGILIAGMMFSFGFSTPFAVGYFIVLNPSNMLLAGIIGGLGAMASDLLIFKFMRFSFMDEFGRLKKTRAINGISSFIEKNVGKKAQLYLMYAFAGILIASPLPDEAGVTMLAGLIKIKERALALVSFILNTIGILIILNI